jgi:lipopolysaccharide transport system ATP-binding protein
MKVRLAFAVASHLDPEILIVDEVLAVGDAAFQKKCLSKMETIGSEGKTVIFVSHDMSAIGRLCKRIILLDSGRILLDGPAFDVIRSYLRSGQLVPEVREWNEIKDAPGNDIVRLWAVRILNGENQPAATINIDQSVDIEMEYEVFKSGYTFLPHFTLNNQDGVCVFVGLDQDIEWQNKARPKGHYVSVARIPGNLLSEGTMSIGPAMRTLDPDLLHFYAENAVSFEIIDSNERGTVRGGWTRKIPGVVRPLLSWRTEFTP